MIRDQPAMMFHTESEILKSCWLHSYWLSQIKMKRFYRKSGYFVVDTFFRLNHKVSSSAIFVNIKWNNFSFVISKFICWIPFLKSKLSASRDQRTKAGRSGPRARARASFEHQSNDSRQFNHHTKFLIVALKISNVNCVGFWNKNIQTKKSHAMNNCPRKTLFGQKVTG